MFLQSAWAFTGLSSLFQNSSKLVALVAAFRKDTSKVCLRKVPVAKMFEEFPDLYNKSEVSQSEDRKNSINNDDMI